MTDKEFLMWIYERLVHVHGESPNLDYMHRLHRIVNSAEKENLITENGMQRSDKHLITEERMQRLRQHVRDKLAYFSDRQQAIDDPDGRGREDYDNINNIVFELCLIRDGLEGIV